MSNANKFLWNNKKPCYDHSSYPLVQLTCELCVLYRQSNIFKWTQKRLYKQISFDQIVHVGKNIFHVLYDWSLVLTVTDILESRI